MSEVVQAAKRNVRLHTSAAAVVLTLCAAALSLRHGTLSGGGFSVNTHAISASVEEVAPPPLPQPSALPPLASSPPPLLPPPPLPPLPPPPSAAVVEAAVVAQHCSPAYRAKAAAAVANGSTPALLSDAWQCAGLDKCSGAFVSQMVAHWRSMPSHYQSLLDMVPCDLFQAIRNRTLFIVGDSNAQRFYKQATCHLAPFMHPPGQQVHDPLTQDPNYRELVYRETVAGWEAAGEGIPYCMRLLGDTMVCHVRVNFGDHMLHLLKRLNILNARKQRDIVSFNFGLWHNKRKHFIAQMFVIKNKWVPAMDRPMIQGLADYWKQHKAEMPIMIWRDHSPQHFAWEHGEYPHPDDKSKMTIFECRPLPVLQKPDGTLVGNDTNVLAGGWRNIVSLPIWKASGIPIQHTWNDTIGMHDGHTHKGDCTHFCSPGAYNVWIWSLWRAIDKLKLPKP